MVHTLERSHINSPFPGMDPYIEACDLWEDFHGHLIEKIAETLAATVPEHYVVRMGERTYVVLPEGEAAQEHRFNPHAEIPTEYRESFIDLYALRPQRQLITSIEVLSPSNKRLGSEGWELYLRKRRGLLLGTANLVEIDLLRGGHRMPMLDPWPDSPYTLLVARRETVPVCHVWTAGFQRPLPTIPVPLAPPDADVRLAIQPMISTIYSRFRYDRDIDYARALDPPLPAAETAWLQQQLQIRSQG